MSADPQARPAQQRVRPPGALVPLALGVATVLLQIAYPLVTGSARNELTIVTVIVFFLASTTHAWIWRGRTFAVALLTVTAGGGFLVEAAGVNLGLPFGAYRYAQTLGPEAIGVPLIIPLAWTMMAYPALVVGRRITRHPVGGPLTAGLALATWDLFLDPQMVAEGHWEWLGGGPALLGIPLSNFAGWVVTAVVMMALLWRAPDAPADDRVPLALYLWVYASSVMAHAVFFDLPGSALVGGIGMGAVVAALVWALRRG